MRPELTGIGAVPHKAAKDAELRSRSGLSPAVISSCAPTTVPTPLIAIKRRVGGAGTGKHALFERGDLLGEIAIAASQGPQRERDVGFVAVAHLGWACLGEGGDELRAWQVAVLVTQIGRGVHQDGLDLSPCRLLGLHCRAARDGQRSQRLDRGQFRGRRCFPGQYRAGGPVGVEPVGLALPAALGWPCPVDLNDPDPRLGDRRGDADAVAARAFDADRLQRSVLDQPRDRSTVAGPGGRELLIGQRFTDRRDDRHVNRVLVRVDAADAALVLCHDGAALPIRWVGAGRIGQTGHAPGPSTGQARIRSCPTGRCLRTYARAGLIRPSATQQGASQTWGHDPRAALRACMSDERCN